MVVLALPFTVCTVMFAGMGVLILWQQTAGVLIALLFVFVVLITAIVSRWLRSTEMRFEGFEFADEATRERWEEICKLEFQVLVPHDPRGSTLRRKEKEIRQRHRLARRGHDQRRHEIVDAGGRRDGGEIRIYRHRHVDIGTELARIGRAAGGGGTDRDRVGFAGRAGRVEGRGRERRHGTPLCLT